MRQLHVWEHMGAWTSFKQGPLLLGPRTKDRDNWELEAETGRNHKAHGPEFREQKKWWKKRREGKRNGKKYLGVQLCRDKNKAPVATVNFIFIAFNHSDR
ncbi:hypothetical protein DEO72_LG7g2466 [Vigna unguiculata]|uniref:Uncharacterized protein n=1 Tax=Vigna unguiculata TaxID=3917 RepID=A0A4D6MIE0_VIGUN|nr:hypothetical protein DEO72_LG7g2466 [Vigna unguiculata]